MVRAPAQTTAACWWRRSHPLVLTRTGLYGHGIGEMAQSKGATVRFVGEVWERSLNETELQQLEHEIEHHKPRLVTVVHCDTPSALLMPREQLERIGAACTKAGSLLMADVVSSFGTTEIDVSRSHIDLAVIGTQKALSCLPDLTVVYVSPRAWERIEQRKYAGYDALLPWRNFRTSEPAFPYTMSWHSVHALHSALEALVHEGPAAVYERHAQVAARTRQALRAMGVRLFIADDSDASPSVTAAFGTSTVAHESREHEHSAYFDDDDATNIHSARWLGVATLQRGAASSWPSRWRQLRQARWTSVPHWPHGLAGLRAYGRRSTGNRRSRDARRPAVERRAVITQ